MFLRITTYIFGLLFIAIGISSLIIYLNLIVNGYTFFEYVNFIIRRFECISLIIGLILVYLSIYIGGKSEIHLRYTTKL